MCSTEESVQPLPKAVTRPQESSSLMFVPIEPPSLPAPKDLLRPFAVDVDNLSFDAFSPVPNQFQEASSSGKAAPYVTASMIEKRKKKLFEYGTGSLTTEYKDKTKWAEGSASAGFYPEKFNSVGRSMRISRAGIADEITPDGSTLREHLGPNCVIVTNTSPPPEGLKYRPCARSPSPTIIDKIEDEDLNCDVNGRPKYRFCSNPACSLSPPRERPRSAVDSLPVDVASNTRADMSRDSIGGFGRGRPKSAPTLRGRASNRPSSRDLAMSSMASMTPASHTGRNSDQSKDLSGTFFSTDSLERTRASRTFFSTDSLERTRASPPRTDARKSKSSANKGGKVNFKMKSMTPTKDTVFGLKTAQKESDSAAVLMSPDSYTQPSLNSKDSVRRSKTRGSTSSVRSSPTKTAPPTVARPRARLSITLNGQANPILQNSRYPSYSEKQIGRWTSETARALKNTPKK